MRIQLKIKKEVKEEEKRQVCGVCPAIGSTMAARRRRKRLFVFINKNLVLHHGPL